MKMVYPPPGPWATIEATESEIKELISRGPLNAFLVPWKNPRWKRKKERYLALIQGQWIEIRIKEI